MVCLMAVLLVGMSLESRADLINGKFDHNLSGWTADEDGSNTTSNVVINSNNQAVLSTAGFLTGPYLVSLWQSFVVPDLATTLSFDINFSNTSIDFVLDSTSGSFPDFFQASYVDDSDGYDAFFMGVDKNGFYDEDFNPLLTPSPLVALENNWFRYTTSITNLVGRSGTLYFDLLDMDEDCYSTAKIDNVTITSAPVPEPSTLLLMGCGFVGLAGVFRKKIKKGLKAV
jgi:hypothetical protein